MKNEKLVIVAHAVSDQKIYYKCPFCFTNRSKTRTYTTLFYKNGREANRIPSIHTHGNETGKKENFTTSRSSHCSYHDGEVQILITDDTIRDGI